MTDRDIMKLALEALENLQGLCTDAEDGLVEAVTIWTPEIIAALHDRLAHCDRCGKRLGGEGDIHTCTPKPEPEPVAWMDPHGGVLLRLFTGLEKNTYTIPLYTTPPQRTEQEPVAWMDIENGTFSGLRYWSEPDNRHEVALYTTTPQRKPLTDEQIDDLSRTMVKGSKSVNWLCRAIEAAHDIKEKNNGN